MIVPPFLQVVSLISEQTNTTPCCGSLSPRSLCSRERQEIPMAARGRGSACTTVAFAVLCVAALLASCADAGMTYVVGDGAGWSRHLESWWLAGKTFRAGDVLVFNYDKEKHDVAWVSKHGYRTCIVSPPGRAPVFTSGQDRITLPRGTHYFICAKPGHCANGMKLAVTAY